MNFNAHTKISDIIRHDKASIDAIATIAPPLKRLKNPVLRKVMASRVTVAEAAKMGGCSVQDFIKVLQPLGYQFVDSKASLTGTSTKNMEKPSWLSAASEADITRFDVRPVIETGTDPLKNIMQKFKEVSEGKILCIVNSFIPTPLIHLLEKEKTEASYVEAIDEKEFHTYFLKKKNKTHAARLVENKVMMDDEQSFNAVRQQFSDPQIKEIDVRGLEMPGPMQTILAELKTLPGGNALYIHHKRVPVYLLEELADKQFQVHIHHIEDGNVKMLIFKQS